MMSCSSKGVVMKQVIIFFTRVPLPNQTKTRLIEHYGAECSAKWHKYFISRIFEQIVKFTTENKTTDIVVCHTDEKNIHILKEVLYSVGIATEQIPIFVEQRGDTIWEKMGNVMKDFLKIGYDKAILIGSDIPEISADDLSDAFSKLSELDLVIGATYDKGYYLIGMKEYVENAFVKIDDEEVFETTIKNIKLSDKTVGLTRPRYDIDTPSDLQEFLKRNQLSDEIINSVHKKSKTENMQKDKKQ